MTAPRRATAGFAPKSTLARRAQLGDALHHFMVDLLGGGETGAWRLHLLSRTRWERLSESVLGMVLLCTIVSLLAVGGAALVNALT